MIKTILGYEIEDGVSPEEYERWLFDVHAPDLMANPYLDRIVFNKVLRPAVVFVADGAPDTTAPTITGRLPAPGSDGVAPATNANATFSEPMDAATITASIRCSSTSTHLPPRRTWVRWLVVE